MYLVWYTGLCPLSWHHVTETKVYGVVPDTSFQSFKLKKNQRVWTKGRSHRMACRARLIHEERQRKARWSYHSYHSSVQQLKFLLFFKQFFSKDVSCYLVLCKWFCKMKIWKDTISVICYLERAWFSILPHVKSLFQGLLICAKFEEEL